MLTKVSIDKTLSKGLQFVQYEDNIQNFSPVKNLY